jgi:hypothetical protein
VTVGYILTLAQFPTRLTAPFSLSSRTRSTIGVSTKLRSVAW